MKRADGTIEPRVIGSLAEYLFAPDVPGQVLDRLADPRTRIVTLTITEGGYNFRPATGEFDDRNAAVQRDLGSDGAPETVFGFVTEALRRRRAAGVAPFTIASCDNIQGNGDIARAMFAAFAELKEPGLGAWLRAEVSFPNSMVDRITPVTTAPAELQSSGPRLRGLPGGLPVRARSRGRPGLRRLPDRVHAA